MFVHLHNHTHYSLLSGLGNPGAFVKRTKDLNMPGLAITDAGNLYGAFEFYKKAKEAGINPIIGLEATISKKWLKNRDKDNEFYEIVLLAKNIEGYHNLIELVTTSYLEGFYMRPRIDFELLERYANNLIWLSGSIMGEIPQHITTGKGESFILDRIAYYEGLFGKDDFYLELQEHPDRGNQPRINDYLIKLSRTRGYKVVATNNVYYIDQSDAEARDLFFCIGDGRTLEDPNRPTLIDGNYSLRSSEEMEELFAHVPEAIKNTIEINDKIHIDIPYGKTLIPTFELGDEEKVAYEKYEELVWAKNSPHPLTPSPFEGDGELVSRTKAKSPEYIFTLAQEWRKKLTDTEEIMWEILRNGNFFSYKFRRQHPLGRYIADFYSEELRLVIEIDGKVHERLTQQEYDIVRDAEIHNRWVRIYRINTDNVLNNLENTLQNLHNFITPLSSEGEGSGVRQEIKPLSSEEWNLRRVCMIGLNSRYNFGFDETTIDEFIHKKNIPGTDKKLMDMSIGELKNLAQEYYTDRKREILSTLTEEQKIIVDRLEYELVVVDLMGFNGYFNIVSDFINYAKENNIPVWPGRWSAAGAILAYLSGITDIDPLPYGLLFERFLNPSRISMPDIDVDFSDSGRDRVITYVREKYGADHVAQICTFGTLAARAAVKDVGKALSIPFAEMNKLAQLIPTKPGTKLKDAIEESIEFKKAYENDERYRMVIDNALKIEGSIRQLGVHACAVIITPEPLTTYCPLQFPPKETNSIVTQFSAKPLEDLGLLKMDFLWLRNLTIIERCLKIVKKNHDRDIDMLKIRFDDKKVLKVFSEGDTTGVFQFESAGMRKYLRDLRPNKFEDIIAMVALYRPGPMSFIPIYIRRKYGLEKVSYMMDELADILTKKYGKSVVKEEERKLTEDLSPFLDVTYGIAVYQEQLMQLAQSMWGFSLGEADILRRWVGKKIRDVVEKLKIDFIKKAEETRGYKRETSEYIYEKMVMPAADYSFNKSHAACYAMISYQTAYLKAYYPTEFMTALMVSDEEDMERITMEIGECKSKGIEILPPDVNESMKHFTYIDRHHIRFGLKAIKGLWDGPIDSIRRGREDTPYTSIYEFIERNNGDVINKKALEALILSGALDNFGERASLFASVPKMSAFQKENKKKQETSQIGLFDLGNNHIEHLHFSLEKANPMSFEQKILGEKRSIGYCISGHWLDGLKQYIDKRTIGREHVTAWAKKIQERVMLETNTSDQWTDDEGEKISPVSIEENADISSILNKWDEGIEVPPEVTLRPEIKAKMKREAMKRVRFIGLITSVRHVQTKTGKMMAIATCDSFDFRFTVLVFSKEYETLSPLLEEDKIVLVEGIFRGNEENGEIAVTAQTIRASTITSIRQQALDMNLFDPKVIVNLSGYIEETTEMEKDGTEKKEDKKKNTDMEESFLIPKKREQSEEYILPIPHSAQKQDLVDLKTYLWQIPPGNIRVFLDIKGQKIDTKMLIETLFHLEKWVTEKGW